MDDCAAIKRKKARFDWFSALLVSLALILKHLFHHQLHHPFLVHHSCLTALPGSTLGKVASGSEIRLAQTRVLKLGFMTFSPRCDFSINNRKRECPFDVRQIQV